MKLGQIKIHATEPPVVELDSEAHAAYIRLSDKPVCRTEPITTEQVIVTIDLDSDGEVVGIELIGVTSFSIHDLMEAAGLPNFPKRLQDRTRYVPASAEYA